MNKLLLLIIIPFFSLSQNSPTKVEYYSNGVIKYQETETKKGQIIIKEFYKSGQLKYEKNNPINTIKTYYKSGQISYHKIQSDHNEKELFYDRNGMLSLEVFNGEIIFNVYESSPVEDSNKNNHSHDHKHGHSHDHHH